MSSVVRMFFVN